MFYKILVILLLSYLAHIDILYSQNEFTFTHILDIGSEEPISEEYQFRGPDLAVQDSKQNLYVVDQRATEIKVFNSSGKYVKTLGKNGRGPGEFLDISSIDIVHGDTLVVFDAINQRFSTLDINGFFESYTPSQSDLGVISVREVIPHKEGYLILMLSSSLSQAGNNKIFFLFDKEFEFLGESYGEESSIWNTDNRFSNYLAYSKDAYCTKIRNNKIYVAPGLHENHITEIDLKTSTEKRIKNSTEAPFSSFILHGEDDYDEKISNKMLFSGVYGKYVVEAINRTSGIFIEDGIVSKFSIQKLNEGQSVLVVDLYSGKGNYLRARILKEYDGHPVNTLKVLDYKNKRLVLSISSLIPKIEIHELMFKEH